MLSYVVVAIQSLSPRKVKHAFCLVGAGPGGVQLGHFFSQSREPTLRDYGILSRAQVTVAS